jgi:hypothetical protein
MWKDIEATVLMVVMGWFIHQVASLLEGSYHLQSCHLAVPVYSLLADEKGRLQVCSPVSKISQLMGDIYS